MMRDAAAGMTYEQRRLAALRGRAARALLDFDVAVKALTAQAEALRHACCELAVARGVEAAAAPAPRAAERRP